MCVFYFTYHIWLMICNLRNSIMTFYLRLKWYLGRVRPEINTVQHNAVYLKC